MGEPRSRQIHRSYNSLVMDLEDNSFFQEARDYLEASRGFQYQEGETVEYDGEEYEIDSRISLSWGKKYVLEKNVKTKKVMEKDIV